ncbi:MAG: glycosyltransferase family 2 protein [Phycisphaeraceae bacterium]|nr:glycosyltransferase family 2 protein [Phycisphaeraceae bacterium]MCW5754398.1 glycosyltransferase family 2 protein [Phycisphaeraceae bacterium]
MRVLIAIPVYNEERYVERVLGRVLAQGHDVLVIDDGSTDATPGIVASKPVRLIQRESNVGYGRSIRDAFAFAIAHGYDWLVTMDCDEQHEPDAIPSFLHEASTGAWDVISGSRYLERFEGNDHPPAERRAINAIITGEINAKLGLRLTDAFCGFKAYRVSALQRLTLTEDGYALPMQFWAQAKAKGLRITEIPVRLIYNDPSRTFGGPLDDADVRLAHYREVFERALAGVCTRAACGSCS